MISITVNDIPPSNNQFIGRNVRWKYQEIKTKWHWLVKAAIRERPQQPYQRSEVVIIYFFKDKRRRDPDNYSGKLLLDPLVREGIIIDDSFDAVDLTVRKGGIDKNNPRTVIEITEVKDDI